MNKPSKVSTMSLFAAAAASLTIPAGATPGSPALRRPAMVRSADPAGEAREPREPPEMADRKPAAPSREGGWRRRVEIGVFRVVPAYSRLSLTTLRVTDGATAAALVPSRMNGPSFDASAGVRLLFVTFAARGGVALYPGVRAGAEAQDFRLLRANGDVVLNLLTGYRLEPYLLLSGGYAVLEGSASALGSTYRIRGPSAEGGLGLDYYPRERVSVGAVVKGGLLFLTRPGTSAGELLRGEQVQTVGEARSRLSEGDGSTFGTGVTLGIGTGLHF